MNFLRDRIIEERKKQNLFIGAGLTLLAIGLIGASFSFTFNIFSLDDQQAVSGIESRLPTFANASISADQEGYPESKSGAQSTLHRDRLVISGANIDMPVFLGSTEKTLRKGGWLFSETSRPEKGGNSVIFGHRYMYRPPKQNTFWNLDKVKAGDLMVLYWQGKEYRYRVSETKVVEPTDLSVIQPTDDSILTVITCTPLFSTKQRLVVIGELINYTK